MNINNNIKLEEFKLKGKEKIDAWLKFERTIPFRYAYNHLSFSYSTESLTISINTKRSRCYKIVKEWIDSLAQNKDIMLKDDKNKEIKEEVK